ncbi:uncharacterized protein HaLaN_33172, partial [Haematococcus lacustris]
GSTACSSHPLWLLAESLGAECHLDYSPDCTTHLVAGMANTSKMLAAQADGKHVVAPSWLQACYLRWG